jgi:hypothetical protein
VSFRSLVRAGEIFDWDDAAQNTIISDRVEGGGGGPSRVAL